MNETDVFFHSVTQAYLKKENPSSPIRKVLVMELSMINFASFELFALHLHRIWS